jgi:hypothetical protein
MKNCFENASRSVNCSADWQSAVSRIGNPQASLWCYCSADYQSAKQQINNLRYEQAVTEHLLKDL